MMYGHRGCEPPRLGSVVYPAAAHACCMSVVQKFLLRPRKVNFLFLVRVWVAQFRKLFPVSDCACGAGNALQPRDRKQFIKKIYGQAPGSA